MANLPTIKEWPAKSVKMISVDELIPYVSNARTHSDKQIDQIAASMNEWGWTNPILVDEAGMIIAGHGRLEAARKLGYSEAPVMTAKGWTESQKKAYVLADNQLALNAGWDASLLTNELKGLDELGFDMDLLGFDNLADLMPVDEPEGLTDEDAVPEAPEVPVTVEGDVWLLGNHRLMCGDSTSIDAVEKLMDGQKADMVFTDPPYGVNYQSNQRTKSDKFDVLKNDDTFLDIAPIVEMFSSGWIFVWTSWKVLPQWLRQMEPFGYPTNQLIWFKGGGGIGDLKKTFSSDYETALVWHRSAELTGKRIGSVWTINKDGATTYIHPTQKPVALGVEAIDKTTHTGASVLDIFGGSGSTLIACEKTNRHCYMMELDPKYCDVIIKRWQDFTGKEATIESTGETYAQIVAQREQAAA